jgi:hypothetical protein
VRGGHCTKRLDSKRMRLAKKQVSVRLEKRGAG